MVMDLHTDKSIREVLTDVIPCVAAGRMLHTMRIYMDCEAWEDLRMVKRAELRA